MIRQELYEGKVLQRDDVFVKLSYEDDGRSCQWYDPNDENDVPLLRFAVGTIDEDGGRSYIPSASYCTQIDASIVTEEQMDAVLKYLMDELYDEVRNEKPIRELCQRLSWVGIDENGKLVPAYPGNYMYDDKPYPKCKHIQVDYLQSYDSRVVTFRRGKDGVISAEPRKAVQITNQYFICANCGKKIIGDTELWEALRRYEKGE